MASKVFFFAFCLKMALSMELPKSEHSEARKLLQGTNAATSLRRTKAFSDNACAKTIDGLGSQYNNIFKTGNRNAASFRWFTYIATCAEQVGQAAFESMGTGFCPISGSPINGLNAATVTLGKVGGGSTTGIMHFCCSPCICDVTDMVKVDTKTIDFGAQGKHKYNVLVHGDPCLNKAKLAESFTYGITNDSTTLAQDAPEVKCDGNSLQGATFSDNNNPIIGLLYDVNSNTTMVLDGDSEKSKKFCADRASAGYDSGMGMIFRRVAGISPVSLSGSQRCSGQFFGLFMRLAIVIVAIHGLQNSLV